MSTAEKKTALDVKCHDCMDTGVTGWHFPCHCQASAPERPVKRDGLTLTLPADVVKHISEALYNGYDAREEYVPAQFEEATARWIADLLARIVEEPDWYAFGPVFRGAADFGNVLYAVNQEGK